MIFGFTPKVLLNLYYIFSIFIQILYLENNTWVQLLANERCFPKNSEVWEERHDFSCETLWPEGRAGHTSVLMDDLLYVKCSSFFSTWYTSTLFF